MTITEFLTARYDEDATVALAAPGREWSAHEEDSIAGASVYDEQWVLLYPEHYDHDNVLSNKPGATGPMYIERARDELCAHIARHDPARVLADVAAKRAIVALHGEVEAYVHRAPDGPDAADSARVSAETLTQVLIMLAQPYASHADFDPEWRVG